MIKQIKPRILLKEEILEWLGTQEKTIGRAISKIIEETYVESRKIPNNDTKKN